MLLVITLAFVAVGSLAGAVEYWLLLQRKFGDERDHLQREPRYLSFATESLAVVGAILVFAGSGVAISQHWLRVTNGGRVAILASVAICFLIAGFLVRWLTGSATQRLNQIMWTASAMCLAGAAAIAAAGVYRQPGAVTATVAGGVVASYTASLWLLCRREMLMVAAFAGLITAFCGAIQVASRGTTPWLAVALGLWLLGIAWVILGWVYPEPLGTSLAAAAAVALMAPALAVHNEGWVYIVGITTAAGVMAAGVPMRHVVMVAFGSCALFSYITAVVFRYADRSLGVPASLVIIGLVLISLAIVTVRLGRATLQQSGISPDTTTLRSRLNAESETATRTGSHRIHAGHVGDRKLAA
jgi:hypothetical protein